MKKLGLIFFIIFLLGLPLSNFWQFFVLTISMGLIFSGSWRLKFGIIPYLAILCIGIGIKFIPQLHIEEGHQILVEERKIVDHLSLIETKTIPNAFSADGIWQHPKYSRVVNDINFQGLKKARLGTLNDLKYNLYPPHSIYIRDYLPFLITYIFPSDAVGLKVWFQGQSFWPTPEKKMEKVDHSTWSYRIIQLGDVGEPIYFVGGDTLKAATYVPSLVVSLEKNMFQQMMDWIKISLILLSIGGVLYGTLEWKDRFKFYLYFGSISIQILYLVYVLPIFFTGLYPLNAGGDGLTYYAYGRGILHNFYLGNIYDALKGGEHIFYFMPGFRYIRALEMSIFGDTYYGYVLAFMFIPILTFKFLRYFFSLGHSLVFLGIFFLPLNFVSRYLGFSDYFYLGQTCWGNAETLAYGCFTTGIVLIFQAMDHKRKTFLGHFLLFIAVACRPNLVLASMFLIGIYTLWILKNEKYSEAIKKVGISWLGFFPILLIPFHNYYFGNKIVLLTSTANIKENLPTPPIVYWHALKSAIGGNLHNPELSRVLDQLSGWNPYLLRFPIVILVISYAFKTPFFSRIGILARMALILHIQLLFFNTSIRYSYIAWFLTIIVFFDTILKNAFVKKWGEKIENVIEKYRKGTHARK